MTVPPEAVQFHEEALALVPELEGRKDLTDRQLQIIITDREQLHLSQSIIVIMIECPKSTVKSVCKTWAKFHRF
jgi:hypothetical protein